MPEFIPFQDSEQAYPQVRPPVVQRKPKWSVWGGQPLNPTCGLISLEKGAKWFLRLYMYMFIFLIVVFVIALAALGFFTASKTHDKVITNSTDATSAFATEVADYESAITGGHLTILVFDLACMVLTACSCYKCIQALEQGTVAQMKIHFCVVFWFLVTDVLIMILSNHETLLVLSFEFLSIIFSVIGILMVYNSILERIQCARGTGGHSRDSTLESI